MKRKNLLLAVALLLGVTSLGGCRHVGVVLHIRLVQAEVEAVPSVELSPGSPLWREASDLDAVTPALERGLPG